ncbi:MAG TPA: DUF305 domain-containing protein [Nostocaceae cyanobacterium]|nr:DUF305 domain-containing protein [Nostocaceae cyanobacterium]
MLNRAFGLLLSGVMTSFLFTTGSVNTATAEHNHPSASPANTTNTTPHQQNHNQHFLKMMIHHNQKGVEMADLAIEKATNPEVKELAAKIKVSQTQEIAQLQALHKQLYGAEVPRNMSCPKMQQQESENKPRMSMHSRMMSLETLRNAANFDQEFLQRMIHHHQMSVMMAQKANTSATNSQLRDLAKDIIKTQTAEIQQMQKLSPVAS